jgi:hypothetical protein
MFYIWSGFADSIRGIGVIRFTIHQRYSTVTITIAVMCSDYRVPALSWRTVALPPQGLIWYQRLFVVFSYTPIVRLQKLQTEGQKRTSQ